MTRGRESAALFVVFSPMNRKLLVSSLAAGALLAVPAAADAAAVQPVYIPGHPSCADRGYDHEIKFYPAYSGAQAQDGVTVRLTVGQDVAWTASKPIGAVIVAGEENANAYEYPDGSAGDYGLRAPGNYYEPYDVRVCWDDETPAPPPPADTPAPTPPPAPAVDTPAPSAPPAQPVVPAPAPQVLGVKSIKASSKLTGPSGCVGRIVKARVTGQGIMKTTFRLDGKRVKTVAGPGSFRVRTATLREGVHRIKARVVLSGAPARTHVVSFQRCVAKRIVPRFAG
jgi:hypothetical protein